MRWESKRPDEVRLYRHDWSAWLGEAVIADATVSVNGATRDSDTHDDTSVTVQISGGSLGTIATVSMSIETEDGQEETQLFTIAVTAFEEPLSVDEAKQQLRVTSPAEDTLIAGYIAAAREWCEKYTGHLLVQREVTDRFDAWGDWLVLSARPVASLTEVMFTGEDGDPIEYEDGVLWNLAYPATVKTPSGGSFPALAADGTISATYLAGYPAAEVPEVALHAMRALIASMHATRGSITDEAKETARYWLRSLRGAVIA